MDFDGEASDGDEARQSEGRGRERAFVEGEKKELEIGEPADEKAGDAGEMDRREVKGKEEEEGGDREDEEEPESGFGGGGSESVDEAEAEENREPEGG